jgi:hypothetical protein
MNMLDELAALEGADVFAARHIGPRGAEIAAMLKAVNAASLDDLIAQTVPESIRSNAGLALPPALSEAAVLEDLRGLALAITARSPRPSSSATCWKIRAGTRPTHPIRRKSAKAV